jgi:tetratricopeptide (TPR) repeat protein
MKALSVSVATFVVAVSVLAAVQVVVPAYTCNREKARVNGATLPADTGTNTGQELRRARELAESCRHCLDKIPNDPDFHTLLGMNEHLLGRYDEAETNYRRALALAERPETYAYLALLQLEAGRLEEARQNLYHACLFDITLVELVSSPMREEIYAAVIARHKQLGGAAKY